jgi:predicted ester cyclase
MDHAATSAATRDAIHRMELALGRGETDMTPYFTDSFVWRGNRGCGVKRGLAAFRAGWQRPFRAAFHDRTYRTERLLADGDWAAAFGHVEATHNGPFMGIAPTGKRLRIPYADFWRVEDGRIADNPVFVDFAEVLWQLGRDVFIGEGWEAHDDGRATPPDDPTL